MTPNDEGIYAMWFESKDNGMIAIQRGIKKTDKKTRRSWCIGFTKFAFVWEILIMIKTLINFAGSLKMVILNLINCFNRTNETLRHKFFEWDKLVNCIIHYSFIFFNIYHIGVTMTYH